MNPLRVLRNTVGLMLLREGPQELPADAVVTYVGVALYIAVNMAFLSGPAALAFAGVLESVAAVIILGVFAHLMLRLRHWPERFNQTFSALLLTGAVSTLITAGPVLKLMPYLTNEKPPPLLLVLALFAVLIWRLAVMAHIFRHALEVGIGRAIGVVILFDLVRFLLLRMLLAMVGFSGVIIGP